VEITRENAVSLPISDLRSMADALTMLRGPGNIMHGLLDEIERLRAGAPAETWRPIETAPQDQRAVLVTHKDNAARVMHVCWRTEPGSPDYLNPRTGATWRPTHWMPLPRHPLDA